MCVVFEPIMQKYALISKFSFLSKPKVQPVNVAVISVFRHKFIVNHTYVLTKEDQQGRSVSVRRFYQLCRSSMHRSAQSDSDDFHQKARKIHLCRLLAAFLTTEFLLIKKDQYFINL